MPLSEPVKKHDEGPLLVKTEPGTHHPRVNDHLQMNLSHHLQIDRSMFEFDQVSAETSPSDCDASPVWGSLNGYQKTHFWLESRISEPCKTCLSHSYSCKCMAM